MNLEYLNNLQSVNRNKRPEVVESSLREGHAAVCAFNRRGTLLAAGCHDGRVVIWDFETRSVARILAGHVQTVTSLSWSRNGRALLSSSVDCRVLVWDILSGVPSFSFTAEVAVLSASIHPSEPVFIANLLGNASIAVNWLLNLSAPLFSPCRSSSNIIGSSSSSSISSSPSSPSLSSSLSPSCDSLQPSQAVFSKTGEFIFVGTTRGHLCVLRYDGEIQMRPQWQLQIEEKGRSGTVAVKGMHASHDERCLLVNCSDKTIRIFVGLDRLLERPPRQEWSYQQLEKIQFTFCGVSGDGDVLVLGLLDRKWPEVFVEAVDDKGKRSWSPSPALSVEDTLVYVTWHPHKSILAACTSKGALHVMGPKAQEESWSAYIPGAGFKELPVNEVYIEREDEFDLEDEPEAEAETRLDGDADGNIDDELSAPDPKRLRSRRGDAMKPLVETSQPGFGSEDEQIDILSISAIPGYSPESDDELTCLPAIPLIDDIKLPSWALRTLSVE